MAPCMDPGSPYYGKVPVTPVMDFQIDNITIHKILLPLRKEVLQELQKKVLENKRKDFLEIFLTMYILLHNIELTIAHDRWFAQRWNVKVRTRACNSLKCTANIIPTDSILQLRLN